MGLVAKVTILIALVTFCQPRIIPDSSKFPLNQFSEDELDYFDQLLAEEGGYDHPSNDLDWLVFDDNPDLLLTDDSPDGSPTYDDDPNWLPTAEDYVDEGEYPEYDSIEDSEEQGDDHPTHDPDWSVTDDDPDRSSADDDDPTWLPTSEDYIEEEEEYPEYDSIEESEEQISEDVGTDPDELWLSDHDPDWLPDDYSQEESTNNTEDADDYTSSHSLELSEDHLLHPLNDQSTKAKRQIKSNWFLQDYQDQNEGFVQIQPLQDESQDSPFNPYTGSSYDYSYVQEPGDIIQESSIQDVSQASQIPQNSQLGLINQASQANQQDIANGIEPLYPISGRDPNDIGSGVEPAEEEAESTGSSLTNWFQSGWGYVVNAADKARDKISGAVDKVQDTVSNAADKVQDAAHSVGESVARAYHNVKDRLRHLFTKFGVLVQSGAEYFILQMEKSADKVRQAEILDKLQRKLEEGSEQVTSFFTLLGHKISNWRESHGQENVDTGLITDSAEQGSESNGEEIIESSQAGDRPIPDLFQDKEVTEKLHQMVNAGLITQSDLDLLVQQQSQQDHSQNLIQIQSDSDRKRSLRALIDALKDH